MNKTYALVGLALLVVLSVALAGAVSTETPKGDTLIAGKIYTANYADTVANATVMVTCGNLTNNTMSLFNGVYSVRFDSVQCFNGMNVTVQASKVGVGTGEKSGVINDGSLMGLDFDLGIVNVPLVPEFGLLIGTLTVVSAIGVFFVIRRH